MQRYVEWVSVNNMGYKSLMQFLGVEILARSVMSFVDIQPMTRLVDYIHYASHVFVAGMLGVQHCYLPVVAFAISAHPRVGVDKFPYILTATSVGFSTVGFLSAYTADLIIEKLSNVANTLHYAIFADHTHTNELHHELEYTHTSELYHELEYLAGDGGI